MPPKLVIPSSAILVARGAAGPQDTDSVAAIKEFEKKRGEELFSEYMRLLTADGVFKGKVPCVACGTVRTPKDCAHDVIVSGCASHHHDS